MLRNRLYYTAKPYIPSRVRLALRQLLARRARRNYAGTWPIDIRTAPAPVGWHGWPDGKEFAFVLTHDVEGPSGLERVPALAELEMEMGFRSSVNFIPEGTYEVPPELRHWLSEQGFEIGVHDLHHDGKLLDSRRGFATKAAQINRHLRDWNAVGFRSAFMLHNLEWFHDLEIQYDLSTFDTDPFEPQPEPVQTIFPFLVPGSGLNSYVELPYTLPQDSTLFLVLQETSPAIWIKKLDWIASQGGMALVNVHPDYLRFTGTTKSAATYPVEHYFSLLDHVRTHHEGRFWGALPRQVAAWAA